VSPLVSILIPAYNSEKWLGYTLESAVAQTWPEKEIIVVDDGSRDQTAAVARRFASKQVKVVTTANQGSAAARNEALRLSQGDYIQWLDADDLLGPDKIERQLSDSNRTADPRVLLSSSWGHFRFRPSQARFRPSRLWQDLSPVEWLLRKMGEDLHMQTATWLTSRELADAVGPWRPDLTTDDDGEYFGRVLLASSGVHFVPDAKVYYRMMNASRVSYIRKADNVKRDSLLVSIKLHIQYLRSLEESERVRQACLAYLQTKTIDFYPERPDLMDELQKLAAELGGRLHEPKLRWKYAWMKPLVGWQAAKQAQMAIPGLRESVFRLWDKAMYDLENRKSGAAQAPNAVSATQHD
jgi:glycosyltransferase involved in cell wall biosynthesis